METFRSEYSEDGLSTSRFDNSMNSVLSFASQSGGSFDSRSARSDFLNNYEQKFRARKAEKKKKTEREAKQQQTTSAEEKRLAEREAEREARKLEMRTWIPDSAVLKRREWTTKKRSRERMKGVLSWYPPASESADVHPLFGALGPAESNNHVTEQQQAAEQEARESFALALIKQMQDLTQKVSYIERHVATAEISPSVARHRRGNMKVHKRRPSREQLEPLRDEHAPSSLGRSASHTSAGYQWQKQQLQETQPTYLVHSAGSWNAMSLNQLHTVDEDAEDAAEMEQFLTLHRRQRKQHLYAAKIQAAWRMYLRKRVYNRWGRRRAKRLRNCFQKWCLAHRLRSKARISLARKYLLAWREEVQTTIRLREIEHKLFRDAETQSELPKLVVNLVFTSTDQDEASRKSVQHALIRQQTRGKFFNSAFASVEHVPDSHRGRVQRMRLQHMKAREAIAKKIVQRMFLLWKKVHQENKRVGLDAQLCIKRAARLAFGSRPVWAGEKLLLVFGIWCRYAAFTRCKRSGRPFPQYTQALPQWDIWVHNYQERQVRRVKATAKAPLARMRRFFCRLHAFSDQSIEKREHMEKALRHYIAKITRAILRKWRDEIAEPAANKKLCRFVLAKFHNYARVKVTLRPRKQAVLRSKQLWDFGRAWRAWKSVHVRSFFKRELNVSRLEQSQWRAKVHRIIYIWMDAKHHVNRWKTFDAWKNYCKKRRLFETLRFHCEKVGKRHLLLGILNTWKAFVWKQEDKFLEDQLQLSAWDAYKELSSFFPMLFYGYYSDAAAVFGGVETKRDDDDDENDDGTGVVKLPYNSDGIRQFQSILVQGSVFEVRNAVLRSNHLINAVEDASGNTPLHVVMNVEDHSHRIDILSLLLSEGAVTWNRPNRHGLTPKQLAPDADTIQLLEQGIYAFYASQVRRAEVDRKSMAPPQGSSREPDRVGAMPGEQRLMWCMVTLLSSEWVRGLRIAGDIKVREWHSVLKEELWLRQERMIFASTSEFSPAILRCRAFLNGMKKKLARSAPHILQQQIQKALHASPGTQTNDEALQDVLNPFPMRQNQLRALHSRGSLRGQQHVSMLTRIVAATERDVFIKPSQGETERNRRAASLGELEPYARFLLTPTLDCEPAERALVHSFVGVLFSLDFSVDDVLVEAFQLESMCITLEHQVWTLHEQLVRAQWKIVALSGNTAKVPMDPSLLCCFSSEFEMEIFFGRQLFVLHIDHLLLERERKRGPISSTPSLENADQDKDHGDMSSIGDVDTECERDALIKEVGVLLTKFQRKMRKIEKKKAALQEHLVVSESQYRATLVSATRSVREISTARLVVESAKLRMTALLLKHSDLRSAIADLETTKGYLVSGDLDKLQRSANGLDTLELVAETTRLIEEEFSRCMQLFRNNDLIANYGKDASSKETESQCLEVRQLFKKAKAALQVLFVANLLRCSCCWLAENMVPPYETDEAASAQVIEYKKNPLLPRSASIMRRRSSVSNARKVPDTLHRGSIVTEAAERLATLMKETYASSGGLLFEMERAAIQEQEKLRQEHENCIVPTIQEINPITGQLEEPPKHLLDVQSARFSALEASSESASRIARNDNQDAPTRRNRKREELRKAIVEHQLKRMTPGYRATDDEDDEDKEADRLSGTHSLLPSIHSASVEFGNFVSSIITQHTFEDPASDLFVAADNHSASTAAYHVRNAESMWKCGAKQTSERGVVLPAKPSSDIFTSAEDESAFNDSFRVLSASRDRRPSSQQQSTGKTTKSITLQQRTLTEFEHHDGVRHTQSVRRTSMVQPHATNITMALGDRPGSAIIFSTAVGTYIARVAESDGDSDPFMLPAADQDIEGPEEENVEAEEISESPTILENAISRAQPGTGISGEEVLAETNAGATEEEALDEYFMRIRTDVSTMHDALVVPVVISAADTHSVSITARGQKQLERRSTHEETNCQDMFSGSRFSAFIKWEKKDAAVSEPLGPIPRIFQDPTSLLGSYTQGERDVRNAQVVPKKKKKLKQKATDNATHFQTDTALVASFSSVSLIDDPSSISLHGTAASMTAKRKKGCEKDGDDASSSLGADMLVDTGCDEDAMAHTISRIVVSVGQPRDVESHDQKITLDLKLVTGETMADREMQASAETQLLELEGRGMASSSAITSVAATSTSIKKPQEKALKNRSKWPFQEPQCRAIALPRQRSDASLTDLQLDGTKMQTMKGLSKSQSATHVAKKDNDDVNTDTPIKLSKQQKQRVWDEFASLQLSASVQNAYAVLYPHMYTPVSSEVGTATGASSSSLEAKTSEVTPNAASADTLHATSTQHIILQRKKKAKSLAHDESIMSSDLRLRSIAVLQRNEKQNSLEQDKKFWSAVEGFKAVGASASILIADETTLKAKRKKIAVRIYEQFIDARSYHQLQWLGMYPEEVRFVTAHLAAAPKHLFNMLQQTAQLRISAVISQRQAT